MEAHVMNNTAGLTTSNISSKTLVDSEYPGTAVERLKNILKVPTIDIKS